MKINMGACKKAYRLPFKHQCGMMAVNVPIMVYPAMQLLAEHIQGKN